MEDMLHQKKLIKDIEVHQFLLVNKTVKTNYFDFKITLSL